MSYAAAEAMGKIGLTAMQALTTALRDGIGSSLAVSHALVTIGDAAPPALCAALRDENKDVRRAVATALGRRKPTPTALVSPLICALSDECQEVRRVAVDALMEIGAPAVNEGQQIT